MLLNYSHLSMSNWLASTFLYFYLCAHYIYYYEICVFSFLGAKNHIPWLNVILNFVLMTIVFLILEDFKNRCDLNTSIWRNWKLLG